MNSGGLAYDEALPGHPGGGLPAYGEALPVVGAADDVPERFDRGKDWPLAFAVFTPRDGRVWRGRVRVVRRRQRTPLAQELV